MEGHHKVFYGVLGISGGIFRGLNKQINAILMIII